MASDKKSGSGWEEAERLGPYQLHEPISDSANDQGELFRATNPDSGTTALVLKLARREGVAPLGDWQVRYTSSSAHHCLSMEVDSSPWVFSKETQSAEELVCVFEDLKSGVRLMDQQLSGSSERVPRRSMRGWVGAALACALALVCFWLARPPSRCEPEPQRQAIAQWVPTEEVLPWTGNSFFEATDGGPAALAHPFPRQPYKEQKRPPCNPVVEVEIMGACWVPHKLKAPCPKELYEFKGECFTTSMLPPAPSNSLEQ